MCERKKRRGKKQSGKREYERDLEETECRKQPVCV